jgi:hypothetical protein
VVVEPTFHDVVVSTYGRGLWVLRDVTPLEMADRPGASGALVLYPPTPGYRQGRSGYADFSFALTAAPTDSVRVEVLDGTGAVIRTFNTVARQGRNRVTWDLRYDGPRQVELRTTPPDNPHIWDEVRFKDKTTRPIVHWGIQSPQRVGPLAAPGAYAVRVTANGASQTQAFRVLRESSLQSPDADLVASTTLQVRIRDAIDTTVDLINRLEVMRHQIEEQLKANGGTARLAKPLRELDQKMLDVELRLLSRTELHSDDKWYVEPYRVYLNLVWLAGEVGTGASDMAGGADYRPTDASVAVFAMLEQELTAAQAAFAQLLQRDVAGFNKTMAGKLPAITDRP